MTSSPLLLMQKRSRGLAGAVILMCLLGCSNALDLADGEYEVFALRYGRSRVKKEMVYQPLSTGEKRSGKLTFGWYVWLLKGNDRVILVDTGVVDQGLVKSWRIRDFVSSDSLLRRMDIVPWQVTDIILTHLHWDHAGNLGPYVQAKIWLQETEYKHAERTFASGVEQDAGMLLSDFQRLQKRSEAGYLNLVEGDLELYPGVSLRLIGDHTPGLQQVVVHTASGNVVLASDSSYLYDNTLREQPTGVAADYQKNLENLRKLNRLAASPWLVIPGHDPDVYTHFPRVTDGIVKITSESWAK